MNAVLNKLKPAAYGTLLIMLAVVGLLVGNVIGYSIGEVIYASLTGN